MSWISDAFDWGVDAIGGFLGGGTGKDLLTAGIGTFLQSSGSNQAYKYAADQQAQSQKDQMELLRYKYDKEFELAKLKLSAGSGSSGSSGPSWAEQVTQANALERYRQILEQNRSQMAAVLRGGENITSAYKNMTDAATAPLLRRTMS